MMLKIFVLFNIFALLCFADKELNKIPALRSASIPLTNVTAGFVVQVNFGTTDTNDFPMLLSLYSSGTFLVDKCLAFTHYECSEFSCSSPDPATSPINLPYLSANVASANAKVLIDQKYWSTNSALLVRDCTSQTTENFGSGAYGILGMGVDGTHKTNFMNSSLFSIYLEADLSKGELLFGFDSSKAQKTAPNLTLSADNNWFISGVNQLALGSAKINITANLLFDVNSKAIGLPLEIFNSLIASINGNKLMTCETDKTLMPTCQYSGEIQEIPNFIIVIDNQSLSLPAQYFVKSNEGEESSITLYFKAIASSLTEESFVTADYENYIIIDRHVMAYYYTLFDATGKSGNTINLFIADHQDHTLLYIILAGSVIFVGLCFCFVVFVFCCSSNPNQTKTQKLSRQSTKKNQPDLLKPLIENKDSSPNSKKINTTE